MQRFNAMVFGRERRLSLHRFDLYCQSFTGMISWTYSRTAEMRFNQRADIHLFVVGRNHNGKSARKSTMRESETLPIYLPALAFARGPKSNPQTAV